MSSQDKVQSNNRGKVREDLAAASGSGPSPQTRADEQGSDKSSQISPMDLSKLSTAPSLDKVNNRLDKWLSTSETPSTGGRPSTQNQENVPLLGDSSATSQDELTKEIDALTKGLFNTQGDPGTIAPANTPQSYDSNGLRARAQSAGDCTGKRPHMGPQTKTVEEGDLPKPLLLRSKSNTVAGASLLKGSQFSMTPGAFEPNASEIPKKPVKHTPPPHGSAQTTSATETNISTLPTTGTASPTAPSTDIPALDGPGINNHDVLENFLEQHQGVYPPMAQFLKDNVTGKPSALTAAEPSLPPPSLAGKTVNSHGLAQPPSPLSFQHAQDNVHLPISGPGRTRPMGVLTELESINNSPPASRFQYFSDLGCQHSSHASIVMRPARPKSRVKRIMQSLDQLRKDCFCPYPVIKICAIDLNDPGSSKPGTSPVSEHWHGSQNEDIFERTGNKTSDHAKSCLPSLDGRLKRGSPSQTADEPGCDASSPPNDCTLSERSGNTGHEASNKSDPPTNACARPKKITQWWKAMRAATAREMDKIRRKGSHVVPMYPDTLLSAGIIP